MFPLQQNVAHPTNKPLPQTVKEESFIQYTFLQERLFMKATAIIYNNSDSSSRQLPQFFQHLHHREGVKFAVAQQRLAGRCLLGGPHGGDARVDVHRLAAVVYRSLQVVIVEFGVVGEEGRQHRLDGESAAHGRIVAVSFLEGCQQVDDMAADVQQVRTQIWKDLRQLAETAAFEFLVVSGHTGVLGDVAAELFAQRPLRVVHRVAQKLAVLQTAIGVFDVQRVLERNLLVGARAVEGRNNGLHRLEIQMVNRVVQRVQEFAQCGFVDMCGAVQRAVHLHLLHRRKLDAGFDHIGKRDDAVMYMFQLLVKRTPVEIENGGLVVGEPALAHTVAHKSAAVGLVAVRPDGHDRFCRIIQHGFGLHAIDGHLGVFHLHRLGDVVDAEQLLDIDGSMANILVVDAHEVSAGDFDAALGEHPFLEGHILRIYLLVGRSAAFHLVDGVSVVAFAEDIHRAIAPPVGEGSLADVLGAVIETLLRALKHRLDVKVAVFSLGGDIGIGAEQSPGEVAHAGASSKAALRGVVNLLFCRLIGAQPETFGALAEIGVFGF